MKQSPLGVAFSIHPESMTILPDRNGLQPRRNVKPEAYLELSADQLRSTVYGLLPSK
jgi:hypothetical protein